MGTIDEFIASTGLRMRATWTDHNNNMPDGEHMDHWRCTITGRQNKRMVLTFSKGIGHKGKPAELAEVLDCLASDASSVEGADFESWCADYGYDTDSRKAERIFKACSRQAASLKRLLGNEDYETLLYSTDR